MQGTVDKNHRQRILEVLQDTKNPITAEGIRELVKRPDDRPWTKQRITQVVYELDHICGHTIERQKINNKLHFTLSPFAEEYKFKKRHTDKFNYPATKVVSYQTGTESSVTLTEQTIPEDWSEEKEEALFHSFLKSIPDPDPEVIVERITTPIPEIISEPVIEIIPEPVVIPEPIKEKKLHLICSSEIAACVRPCYHYIKSHISSSTTIAEIMDYYSLTEEQSIVLLNTVGRKYASEIKIRIEAKAV